MVSLGLHEARHLLTCLSARYFQLKKLNSTEKAEAIKKRRGAYTYVHFGL
jgi:hypothetical protein